MISMIEFNKSQVLYGGTSERKAALRGDRLDRMAAACLMDDCMNLWMRN